MHRVVHFEIHADDPERCAGFYREVFGWEIDRWGDAEYWICRTGPREQPGIDGGILRRRDPGGHVYNTIQVPSLEDFTARIERSGGKNVVPRMPVHGVGWLAYFQDTEGNVFGVMEPDEKAAG